MIKLLVPLAKTLFALFVLAVFAGVMYYSFNALGLIFPGDLAGQMFGMALFDLAALVWFLHFVKNCHSTMQYVFSAIGFMLGIVGTLGLVGIEVGITSGLLEAAPMAKPLSYIFIGALVGHLLLIYATHAAAPEIAADISLGVERAKIVDQAQKDAERMLMNNQQALAGPIAEELVRRVLHDLNLQPRGADVLDLQALDVSEPAPSNDRGVAPNFLSKILSGLGRGARKYESSVASVLPGSPQPTKTPSPAQESAVPAAGEDSKTKVQEPVYNPTWLRLEDLPVSIRNSIIPWHCGKCDNWYVSDKCPRCGMLAPELRGNV